MDHTKLIQSLVGGLSLVVAACSFAAEPAASGARIFSQNARPEWQWSVLIQSVVSSETQGHSRAFLWIPPGCQRAKFPVKLTVVAWQWGRPVEPRIQSARPVERTLLITR